MKARRSADLVTVSESTARTLMRPWSPGVAPQAAQHRAHEELEGDEAAHRVARQAEEDAMPAIGPRCAAVGQRLAGLDGHAPQVERADLLEDVLDDVVGADRDATGDDQHIGGEDTLEQALTNGVGVITGDAQADRLRRRPR